MIFIYLIAVTDFFFKFVWGNKIPLIVPSFLKLAPLGAFKS